MVSNILFVFGSEGVIKPNFFEQEFRMCISGKRKYDGIGSGENSVLPFYCLLCRYHLWVELKGAFLIWKMRERRGEWEHCDRKQTRKKKFEERIAIACKFLLSFQK